MTICDYMCPQNNNGKCIAPGYRECLRAKDDMYNHTSIEGNTYYVFGKKNAKKAKKRQLIKKARELTFQPI